MCWEVKKHQGCHLAGSEVTLLCLNVLFRPEGVPDVRARLYSAVLITPVFAQAGSFHVGSSCSMDLQRAHQQIKTYVN